MRVLLTGGGTAGHINPALAIAETVLLNDPSAEVAFVGTVGGKEEDLVPRNGYTLYTVKSQGFQRRLTLSNVKTLWLALTSPYSKSTNRILDEFQPDIVIGTGGYACWPIMAAAARRRIPTALHESNALPGLAIRQLQGRVDRIWVNFDRTISLLRHKKQAIRVGNPLRGGFGSISRQQARERLGISREQLLVLSFGGSLGAENVNSAALSLMKRLAEEGKPVAWIHGSGKRDYSESQKRFCEMGLDRISSYQLVDYIYDMPTVMAAADLVISRAGAMTLSELAGMGKAAILIPSPNVTSNHQYHNAKALSDVGAAVLVCEDALSSGGLDESVEQLLGDPAARMQLSEKIEQFACRDANRMIWQDILELTKPR